MRLTGLGQTDVDWCEPPKITAKLETWAEIFLNAHICTFRGTTTKKLTCKSRNAKKNQIPQQTGQDSAPPQIS